MVAFRINWWLYVRGKNLIKSSHAIGWKSEQREQRERREQ